MLPFAKKKRLPDRNLIELEHAKTIFKNVVSTLDGVSEFNFTARDCHPATTQLHSTLLVHFFVVRSNTKGI